jgi:hypothetical protein
MGKTRKRRGGGWFSIYPAAYTSLQNRVKTRKDSIIAMNRLEKRGYDPAEIQNDAKETTLGSSKYQNLRKKAAEIRAELINIENEKEHIYNLELLKIIEKNLKNTYSEAVEDFQMARY